MKNISISYGDVKRKIKVEVLKKVDLLKQEERLFKTFKENYTNIPLTTRSLTTDVREQIRLKALAMCSYAWRPSKDLIGWKNRYTFKKDKGVLGIPYSQTPYQSDEESFHTARTEKNDFYDPLYFTSGNTKYAQPRYGNDCSGFTSFCWGISRQNLLDSYELMQLGDAVVYRNSLNSSGHVFIIAVNFTNENKVQCFEQTPYTCSITNWTYDQLAAKKYMPFAKE